MNEHTMRIARLHMMAMLGLVGFLAALVLVWLRLGEYSAYIEAAARV